MIIKLLLLLLSLVKIKEPVKIVPAITSNYQIPIKEEKKEKKQYESPIGYIKIESINLFNKLYNPNSKLNNIEENITILKASQDIESTNSLIVLAAHSGEGKIAYFNNLDQLTINEEITLNYYNHNYTYIITNIFEEEKKGYIKIAKTNESQLILTTCSTSNKNKQLIIESKLKEP